MRDTRADRRAYATRMQFLFTFLRGKGACVHCAWSLNRLLQTLADSGFIPLISPSPFFVFSLFVRRLICIVFVPRHGDCIISCLGFQRHAACIGRQTSS